MANNEQFLTMNSSKIVSTKKDVIIGEDNTDILNINSKLSFSGRDNIILPTPVSSESNKLLKIDNSGNNLELDDNGIGNNSKVYIVCSELSSDNWGDITPVDGELTVFPGQEIMFYINASGTRGSSSLNTWTFKYKIDNDSSFTTFNYPTNSQFKHCFNSLNDNQHRSATFYFRNNTSTTVVFKKFQVTYNGYLDNSEDFVTITGVVLNSKEYPLAGAGGTESFTAYSSTVYQPGYGTLSNLFNNYIYYNDNSSSNTELVHLTIESSNYWFVGIEFLIPQILSKYRIWGRWNGSGSSSGGYNQAPKSWELRASVDKAVYDSGTYTLLDLQTNQSFASYSVNGEASNNLLLANEYNILNIEAYKYYVIHFTENHGNSTYLTMSEVALYSDISLHKQVSSFTQEQALAGAGGTASFTANVSSYAGNDWSGDKLHDNNIRDDSNGFIWASDGTSPANGTAFNSSGVGEAWVSYEFITPQIITKYRLWPRFRNVTFNEENQNIRIWELRATTDSATYNRSDSSTYTVLDSQSLPGTTSSLSNGSDAGSYWKTDLANSEISSSNDIASNNLHIANEYNLSSFEAYKYYELYITGNYGNIHASIAEWGLYAGGFILPNQTNNANKKLITNGINLEWSNDVEPILTGSGSSHEIIKVNPNSNGLEYGGTDAVKIPCANNSFRPYQSKNGMMRYNNESNYYELYNNGWHKIITKDMYETSIGLLNRDFTETDYNDKINNSYGYYVHGRNNPPLFSGTKLSHNIYHSLTFDTVLYDNSPLQNMADISNNRINIKKTGDYLINYKSSFNLTNTTQQLSTNFKIKLNKNDNLLYESNLIKASSGLINNKTHYFIDDFNYITSLAEGDYITIELQQQSSSNNLMLSYDYVGGYSDTTGYNIDENYNYEYMKYIASQLIVKKLLIV